jgi:hypothetical protein
MKTALLATVLALGVAATAAAQGPSTEGARTLSKGTKIAATLNDSISSRNNKIGDQVAATITNDVKDANGNIVFPAGSPAKVRVIDIKAGDSKDKNGALALQVSQVSANGQTYYLNAANDSSMDASRKPGWTSDKKKIGIGAAAGAVVGGLASGSLKGALAGGLIGAAGGAVVSHEMNGRDVYLKAGSNVDFVLSDSMQARLTT